jgi:hypothetical protein
VVSVWQGKRCVSSNTKGYEDVPRIRPFQAAATPLNYGSAVEYADSAGMDMISSSADRANNTEIHSGYGTVNTETAQTLATAYLRKTGRRTPDDVARSIQWFVMLTEINLKTCYIFDHDISFNLTTMIQLQPTFLCAAALWACMLGP